MSPELVLLIMKGLDLVAAAMEGSAEWKSTYDRLSDNVKAMVAEGRDPTPEEFASLMAESDDATQRIRDALAGKAVG